MKPMYRPIAFALAVVYLLVQTLRAADNPLLVLDETKLFSLELPSETWRIDPPSQHSKAGQPAKSGLSLVDDATPSTRCSVSVSPLPFGFARGASLEKIAGAMKTVDESYFKKATFLQAQQVMIEDQEFYKFGGPAEINTDTLYYEKWTTIRGGRLYAFSFFTKTENQASLKTVAEKLAHSFRVLGQPQVPGATPREPVVPIERHELEFAVPDGKFSVTAPSNLWVVSEQGKRLWDGSALLLQEGAGEAKAWAEVRRVSAEPTGDTLDELAKKLLGHVTVSIQEPIVGQARTEKYGEMTFLHNGAEGRGPDGNLIYREHWVLQQAGYLYVFRFEGASKERLHVGEVAKDFCKSFKAWGGNDLAAMAAEPLNVASVLEYRKEQWNFSLGAPEQGEWFESKKQQLKPGTALMLGEGSTSRVILIQVNKVTLQEGDTASLLALCQKGLSANPNMTDVGELTVAEVQGKQYLRTTYVLKDDRKSFVESWFILKTGNLYQISFMGPPKLREELLQLGKEMMPKFHFLNEATKPKLQELHDERWAVETNLKDQDWVPWEAGKKNFPSAIFHANKAEQTLVIYPLPNASGKLDFLTVAKAMLQQIQGMTWEKCESTKRVVKVTGAQEAVELIGETQQESKPIRWLMRVIKAEGRYFLVLGSTFGAIDDSLRKAVASVTLLPFKEQPKHEDLQSHERQLVAKMLHTAGLITYERRECAAAAGYFAEAFGWFDQSPRILECWSRALFEAGQRKQALEVLVTHRDEFPRDMALAVYRARMEYENGDQAGSAHLAQLFQEGHRNEDDLLTLLGMLWREHKSQQALEVVERFLEHGGGSRVRRWLATAHDLNGDSAKALELLEELVQEPPFDPETGNRYLEIANNAGSYQKTLTLADRMNQDGHGSPRVLMAEGWAHAGLKDWGRAKQCFETAAKQLPNEPSVREAIARASAALGEGDNSRLKHKLEPLPLPEALQKEMSLAKSQPAPDNASGYFEHRITIINYQRAAPVTTTVYRTLRVLDSSAVQDWATMSFAFDPLTEDLYVNQLIVRDPDGSEAARLKPEEQYLIDESANSAMATQRKVVRLAVPGLKVGRTIELVLTRRDSEAPTEFPWHRITFGSALPTKLEAVVVAGAPDEFTAVGNALFNAKAKITRSDNRWMAIVRDQPQITAEENLPAPDAYLTSVCLGPAKADWQQLARDYLELIREKLEPEQSVTVRAKELTKNCSTLETKVKVLAQAVQRDINYQGIEFGRRARIPNAPAKVLSCHYGDCKDQALLLRQMLRAVDVPASLALVSTNYDVLRELPSMDQFNHMIVYVPGLPAAFVDTTGRHQPVGDLPPSFYGHSAFILDPDGSRVVGFPSETNFPADEVKIARRVTYDADGAAKVTESQTLSGRLAANLRESISSVSSERRRAHIQQFYRQSDWLLDDLQVENLDALEAPLIIKVEYRITNAANAWRLPKSWESAYLSVEFNKQRRLPFEIFHPLKFTVETTLAAKEPFAPKLLQGMEAFGKSDFLHWQIGVKGPNRVLFSGESTRGQYPKERHVEWHEAGQRALEALSKPLH